MVTSSCVSMVSLYHMLYEVEQSFFENCVNILTQNDRLPDLVFAPTLAFTRFSEDLLLRYAMITARSPARRLTWILLPAPGLDFQPQTQTVLSILVLTFSMCKHFFSVTSGIVKNTFRLLAPRCHNKHMDLRCARFFQNLRSVIYRSSRRIDIVYQQYTAAVDIPGFSRVHTKDSHQIHGSLGRRQTALCLGFLNTS